MEHPLLKTLEQLIEEKVPNFFRLYLNPYVAQTCYCLNQMVQDAWYGQAAPKPEFQTFLANSSAEALSGAVKLARFWANRNGHAPAGVLLGGRGRFDHFATLSLGDRGRLQLIPEVSTVDLEQEAVEAWLASRQVVNYVVLCPPTDIRERDHFEPVIKSLVSETSLIITCVNRTELQACRSNPSLWWESLRPDIVVFDESFVHHGVPFGAFSARRTLYELWNRRGYSTFHSTTFQPNSISTLHFLKCLEEDDPALIAALCDDLHLIATDPVVCKRVFARCYNPALAKTITSLGFNLHDVKAADAFVTVHGRRIFDGVAGIACSMRGHNPPDYVKEITTLPAKEDYSSAVRECLTSLTGLEELVPAVSGASAVENALRLGLAARFPQKYVLALKGGFGGKTLVALTGTAKPSYKKGLDPLYPHVIYVDPFGEGALEELEQVFAQHAIGVVQMELVQAVGGVRPIPERVVRYLDEARRRHGCLLFVDEVQTGMYRTGPFTMCRRYGLTPDLLALGKGTTDMMFPFAATLHSRGVAQQVEERCRGLADSLRSRANYEMGYRTLLNTLLRAEAENLSQRVLAAGEQFATRLSGALASCPVVKDIRRFGLLIGIELDTELMFRKRLRKPVPFLYLLNMLRHPSFPVLMGFCQSEPHVLKLTPPLTITPEEIESVCATIVDVLKRPSYKLVPSALAFLTRTYVAQKWQTVFRRSSNREPAPC